MVSETALLAALMHDREAFLSVVEHIDPTDMSAHGEAILSQITDYYQRDDNAERCDPRLIRDRVCRKLPKHAETFKTLIQEMTPELGSANVVREVLDLKRRAAGEALMVAIAQGQDAADMAPVLAEYTDLNEATDLYDTSGGVQLLDTSFGDLMRISEDKSTLIKMLPKRFNDALRGGMLPGHTVVWIGRVNVGKSAHAINNIAGFLRQGLRVLLIENEDLADDVKRRIGCRLNGCSLDWAEKHPDTFDAVARKRGGELLMIPDPVPGTVQEIDRLAAVLKPDVIVVNQLRHLASNKAAEGDAVSAVDRIGQKLRALGKRRRILMCLVGAAKEGEVMRDGETREKAVLGMADSYGSRTGIPGIADAMFAIGDNTSLKERGMVAIHLCKNKRGGAEPVLYQRVNLENCTFEDA
jgi:hypothetical protein